MEFLIFFAGVFVGVFFTALNAGAKIGDLISDNVFLKKENQNLKKAGMPMNK